jgi:hypothetical protein
MGNLARSVAVSAALLLSLAAACSNGTPPAVHPGDDITDNTNEGDTGIPATPPPSGDSGMDDSSLYDDSGFQPMLGACSTCSCSTKKGFCFGGGVTFHSPPLPLGGHSDAGDGGGAGDASEDTGPAACPMVSAGTNDAGQTKIEIGCNTLPAACAATPTCGCVLEAIQPQFACYLVCTPDDGYLLVYCPNGP